MKQLLFFINFFTECLRYISYSIFQLISIVLRKINLKENRAVIRAEAII